MKHHILLSLALLGACASSQPAPAPPEAPAAQATAWTCPMHTSIRQTSPGQCPICGMELVPVTAEQQASGEVIVDEARRQRVGIVTTEVHKALLTRQVQAIAELRPDEARLHAVTLRVGGRIRAPAVTSAGQRVRAGQRLFDLESPEIQAAEADLLAAKGGPGEAAARARLRLWDVPEATLTRQLAADAPLPTVPVLAPASGVVQETSVVDGAELMPGDALYQLADLSHLWAEAWIEAADLPFVHEGDAVRIGLTDAGGEVAGTVLTLLPAVDPMTRARRVRVGLDNADGALVPGMAAELRAQVSLGEALSVPLDAVIFAGARRLVFVDLGEGRLRPREVELGTRAGDRYEIRSGLQEGDRVVSQGTFLVAAESRIRSAATVWGGDDAHD